MVSSILWASWHRRGIEGVNMTNEKIVEKEEKLKDTRRDSAEYRVAKIEDNGKELVLYLRKEKGTVMMFPNFTITWKQSKTAIYSCMVEGFGFEDGGRDGFGADVTVTAGGINVTPLREGYQGWDADWYRYGTDVKYGKDGSVTLTPIGLKVAAPKAKMKPEIKVTKEGIEVADKLIKFKESTSLFKILSRA